jgi:hypothetical protein
MVFVPTEKMSTPPPPAVNVPDAPRKPKLIRDYQHQVSDEWEKVVMRISNAPHDFALIFWTTEIGYNPNIIIQIAKNDDRWNGTISFVERNGAISSFIRKVVSDTGGVGRSEIQMQNNRLYSSYAFGWP